MAVQRREVLKLGVVDVGIEKAELPNGVTVELAVVRHPGASAIVALDEHRRVTLLRQWRHAMGGWIWEIPAGCRRAGESARACAERELSEETGLGAQRWDHLGAIVTIPSFCDERIELYLARELEDAPGELDHDEVISATRVDLEEALAMITRGEMVDAKSIVALLRTRDFLADAK
jgi:8-oxo-dGTP pyrophosphatase MutT (NUDIX family)